MFFFFNVFFNLLFKNLRNISAFCILQKKTFTVERPIEINKNTYREEKQIEINKKTYMHCLVTETRMIDQFYGCWGHDYTCLPEKRGRCLNRCSKSLSLSRRI